MIITVLLVAAAAASIAGSSFRRHRAAQPSVPDRQILAVDAATAATSLVFLVPAAIAAQVYQPLTGGQLGAVVAATVLTAGVSGSSVVRLVLAAGGIPTRADNHDDPVPGDPDDTEASGPPLRGGRIIGILERIGVSVCLLIGWPAGLPVILGVKSLARFSELRAPHASEQFILGTFASVLWACGVSGIGHLAIT